MTVQVNLDMTDSMGPGKLVRHMQNPSHAYDEYLICIGLGPSISSVVQWFAYPSSPVVRQPCLPQSHLLQFFKHSPDRKCGPKAFLSTSINYT